MIISNARTFSIYDYWETKYIQKLSQSIFQPVGKYKKPVAIVSSTDETVIIHCFFFGETVLIDNQCDISLCRFYVFFFPVRGLNLKN